MRIKTVDVVLRISVVDLPFNQSKDLVNSVQGVLWQNGLFILDINLEILSLRCAGHSDWRGSSPLLKTQIKSAINEVRDRHGIKNLRFLGVDFEEVSSFPVDDPSLDFHPRVCSRNIKISSDGHMTRINVPHFNERNREDTMYEYAIFTPSLKSGSHYVELNLANSYSACVFFGIASLTPEKVIRKEYYGYNAVLENRFENRVGTGSVIRSFLDFDRRKFDIFTNLNFYMSLDFGDEEQFLYLGIYYGGDTYKVTVDPPHPTHLDISTDLVLSKYDLEGRNTFTSLTEADIFHTNHRTPSHRLDQFLNRYSVVGPKRKRMMADAMIVKDMFRVTDDLTLPTLSGSFSRGTMVYHGKTSGHMSDLDFLVHPLKLVELKRFVEPSLFLGEFYRFLGKEDTLHLSKGMKIRIQRRSVGVIPDEELTEESTRFHQFDMVPAVKLFPDKDDSPWVISHVDYDSRVAEYIRTYPTQVKEVCQNADMISGGFMRRAIVLAKLWKYHKGSILNKNCPPDQPVFKVRSFHIELLAYSAFPNKPKDLRSALLLLFEHILKNLDSKVSAPEGRKNVDFPILPIFGNKLRSDIPPVSDYLTTEYKSVLHQSLKEAIATIEKAIRLENEMKFGDSFREWVKLYGEDFMK